MSQIYSILMRLPSAQRKIKTEMAAARRDMQNKLGHEPEGMLKHSTLPKDGYSLDWIHQQLDSFENMHASDWQNGRVSGAVYYGIPGEKVDEAMKAAVLKYILSNRMMFRVSIFFLT